MLPIIGSPGVVKEFAGFFHRLFSWNLFRRFKQYLSGLNTDGKATVRSMAFQARREGGPEQPEQVPDPLRVIGGVAEQKEARRHPVE